MKSYIDPIVNLKKTIEAIIAIMLTTFAEIAVLLAMSTRVLDGYFTDSLGRVRQYLAKLLSFGINCNPYLARV